MKLAIMQPYFFPYIGYFQLINAVDRFILLNDVQYIRHGWINRNRILKPGDGVQYIIAPLVKHQQKTAIKDIYVTDNSCWKQKIVRQIDHYRRKAPYFLPVYELLTACFENEATSIADLNEFYLKNVCKYIGIKTPIISSSNLKVNFGAINDKDDWALQICEQANASEYINPIRGIELFKKEKFVEKDIRLSFLKMNTIKYEQRRRNFEASLSIIDIMMYNEPDEIQLMLKQFQLV